MTSPTALVLRYHLPLSVVTQKIVSKLSEIWSGLSIPDPEYGSRIRNTDPGSGSWFFTHLGSRIPDPGVKKAPDPGSGSATLPVLHDTKGSRQEPLKILAREIAPEQKISSQLLQSTFFSGLECAGHSFAYVAHLRFWGMCGFEPRSRACQVAWQKLKVNARNNSRLQFFQQGRIKSL
jgi:hypothetical protein